MYYSSIAQLVEQSAVNRSVVGSSPTRGAICGPLVKRLRHRPFTAVSGVRFPHGSPIIYGRLAQLGERLPYKQDVGSSILSSSTTYNNGYMPLFFLLYCTRYRYILFTIHSVRCIARFILFPIPTSMHTNWWYHIKPIFTVWKQLFFSSPSYCIPYITYIVLWHVLCMRLLVSSEWYISLLSHHLINVH